MKRSLASKDKRRSVRFDPDPGTIAQLDLEDGQAGQAFAPKIVALVPEESVKGVGLVVLSTEATIAITVGDICRVQVGKLSPLRAEIRWRKELDEGLLRLGLLYLE